MRLLSDPSDFGFLAACLIVFFLSVFTPETIIIKFLKLERLVEKYNGRPSHSKLIGAFVVLFLAITITLSVFTLIENNQFLTLQYIVGLLLLSVAMILGINLSKNLLSSNFESLQRDFKNYFLNEEQKSHVPLIVMKTYCWLVIINNIICLLLLVVWIFKSLSNDL